mmetsp:Transcript_15789/g.44925  ORF Transcript_15789/g.44925 Transcript_15789/m.44925 type:complete len:217 (-) Transcript_15789:670-1320(-)
MWPYRSSAFDESSSQWCTAVRILASVMTLFVVGSGVGSGDGSGVGSADGSGVSKQELSSSRMSPDPSFLHFHRPFVPTPYTQFCSGLKRPSIYPEQVSQLCGRCQVPPPQLTPSGKTTRPSTVWASVGCGCEGLGEGCGVGRTEGAGACGAISLEPHHSALLQLSQLLRENEHQSTLAAGWSQSPQLSPDEDQKQQPSKGTEVGSGVSTQSPPSSS